MGLFSKNTSSPDIKGINAPISSILSQDMQITGEIRFSGKTRIDAAIDGNVFGEYLVLSEAGKIVGDVKVDTLICHGTIRGNVTAKTFIAQASSVIHGTVTAGNLTVESGAALNGEIKAAEETEKKTLRITSKQTSSGKASAGSGKEAPIEKIEL
jgi:cytoskeletal protein CcmA (bactofilin family)